ncbi:MAG: extracellular solute-binding protein [Spirochaetia bacterium]|nr:extracellular solute-binding protein [Spirochaetia bacterium]MCF7946857.1 extracellular solute-binding protein [Spirochaetia bacterium]
MRKLLFFLMMMLITFSLAAKGDQEGQPDAKGDAEVLRVWKFGGPQHEREYMIDKIKVFEERNPDIVIDWVYQNYAERRTKVITADKAGNLPEIILSDGQSIPEFAALGIIKDLEEIDPNKTAEWEAKFVPEAWDTGKYEGSLFGVSTYVDTASMIAYNTEMFKEEGIVDNDGNPRPPQDWEEVIEIAKLFSKKGIAGIALPGSNAPNDTLIMEGIAYRNGGRLIDNGTVSVNGPGFVDTMEFYKELVPYAQNGFTDTNFRQAMELFFQNQSAMAFTMSYAPILRQSLGAPADFPYNIAPFPGMKTPSGNFDPASFIMTPTACFMIPVSVEGEKLDAAMRFVDFWMTAEAQEGWSGSVIEGRVPIMKSNLESADFARIYPDLAEAYKNGTLFDGALPMPGFKGLAESEQLLIEAYQKVLLGVEEPKEAFDAIQPKIQTIYDEAQ